MSDFAGIIRSDGGPVDESTVDRMMRSLDGSGKPRAWRPDPSCAFVERRGFPSHDNGSKTPPIQRSEGRIILATAWLSDPRGVRDALALPGSDMPDHRSLLALATDRWGPLAAAERLHGNFAVAQWDERERRLTIARDALGSRPVYYAALPGMIVFATTLQAMLALPQVPRDLDEVMLAHSLTLAMQDQEQTLYRHIRRVPPGGSMTWQDGRVQTARWFTADRIKPVRYARDEDYVEAARELLDRSVAARLSADGRTGVTLSGGFDSTGVAATAARLMGDNPLLAFTRAAGADHPEDGIDERRLAGVLAARYANIEWNVIDDARENPRDVEPEIEMGALLVPRRGSFNGTWFESLLIEVDRRGVDVLLNGGVGNSTLSWEGNPDYAARLKRLQLRGLYRDLRAIGRQHGVSPARVAASAAWLAHAPRRWQRWANNRRIGSDKPWLDHCLVSPGFLDEVDYAAEGERLGHDIPFRPDYDSRELRLRMLQGQTGRDMASFARRRWAGARRDPYHDRAMVEFTLGIPGDQYWRNGTSRWLARRVLADRVPAEILSQRRKGRQSPEWYFLATRRLDQTAEAIERVARSPLASRVLDIPRMREIVATWPKDAESARDLRVLYGHALNRAISMGGFLRWHEGSNE
ncbi:asparagine synthase-related protein [Sphingomonas sp. HF-S3]|uniref:asparagine synthase (glutamine-hydrolyzing) n=1 Tax=Sphingomonas rustica TaxID=3103142 RepID=A0ABV0BFQ0_9SPHN